MSIGVGKLSNEYAQYVDDIDAPKTVWMALAFSLANQLTDGLQSAAHKLLIEEWDVLHQNGIIPQKPSRAKGRIAAQSPDKEQHDV